MIHRSKVKCTLDFIFYIVALTIVISFIGIDKSFVVTETHFTDMSSANPKCDTRIDSFAKILVYENVDLEPSFPGGPPALTRYLNRNLKYPDIDEDSSYQLTATVSFIVKVDGALIDIHIDRKRNGNGLSSLEKVVLDLYKDMPEWIPGKCNGHNVPVRVRRSISIHLEEK